jgi:hypothetical protein
MGITAIGCMCFSKFITVTSFTTTGISLAMEGTFSSIKHEKAED